MKAVLIIIYATTHYGWGETVGFIRAYPSMSECKVAEDRTQKEWPEAYTVKCEPYPLEKRN